MSKPLDEVRGVSPLEALHMHIDPNQFTLAIKCHWCGHKGSSLWERTPAGRQLVNLRGFYERLAKKAPYDIEMVCDYCNRAQPQ